MYLENNGLSDLTDQEAITIITDEFKSIPSAEAAAMLLSASSGNYAPLAEKMKAAITKLCVKGAASQAGDILDSYWIPMSAALAAGGYFVSKNLIVAALAGAALPAYKFLVKGKL